MSDEPNAAHTSSGHALDDLAMAARTAPAIVAALGDGDIQVIETHAARVLVGRTHALKIKRPVRYAYLDFSTLAQRRAALARELELNRPHAPDIYLRLVRLTATDDGIAIDGTGATLDHGLLMRRFEQHDVLRARLGAGPLPLDLCKALADMVARYHADAPAAFHVDAPARTRQLVSEIAAGLAAETASLGEAQPARWRIAAEAAVRSAAAVLAARADAGFLRRCHGDLHSGNVVVWQGRPLAFDALEFDERLATIDTLYDLAFLVMDLDEHGHRPEANVVFNRYLWRTQADADVDGLAALPLFLSLRAAIRALVGAQKVAARTAEGDDGRARDAEGAAAARTYLTTALGYLADAGSPRLVAIGGLSGTGKSTLGTALSPCLGRAPGALHLRSDLERKAMAGVAETERLAASSYTKASSDAVYARLLARAGRALAAGHSVVLDAVWLTGAEQHAARDLATRHGARFDALWLSAPLAVLQSRVGARTGDASDATAGVVARQAAADVNSAGWPQIDASGSPGATLVSARKALCL